MLQALWDHGPGTVRDVLARLGGGERAYTTIQTLLTRLKRRGYVKTRRQGRALVFEARADRQDLLHEELRGVASRVTGGKVSPLVLNLVERNDLTPEDVRRLRELLDRLEREQGESGG